MPSSAPRLLSPMEQTWRGNCFVGRLFRYGARAALAAGLIGLAGVAGAYISGVNCRFPRGRRSLPKPSRRSRAARAPDQRVTAATQKQTKARPGDAFDPTQNPGAWESCPGSNGSRAKFLKRFLVNALEPSPVPIAADGFVSHGL
jgi:hypothetical protein